MKGNVTHQIYKMFTYTLKFHRDGLGNEFSELLILVKREGKSTNSFLLFYYPVYLYKNLTVHFIHNYFIYLSLHFLYTYRGYL